MADITRWNTVSVDDISKWNTVSIGGLSKLTLLNNPRSVITKGFIGGGLGTQWYIAISSIDIATLGNAAYWGDFGASQYHFSGASFTNGPLQRYIAQMGYANTADEYFDMTTAGNAVYIRNGFYYNHVGASNNSNDRGFQINGTIQYNAWSDRLYYTTISTLSSMALFGYNYSGFRNWPSAFSNGVNERAVYGGTNRVGGAPQNSMEYITMNSLGNGTYFGNFEYGVSQGASADNLTNERGIHCCGYNHTTGSATNAMQSVTINTLGNAAYFGNSLVTARQRGGLSNGTKERGVIAGGVDLVNNYIGELEYVTMNSLSNALAFGDAYLASSAPSTGSNA